MPCFQAFQKTKNHLFTLKNHLFTVEKSPFYTYLKILNKHLFTVKNTYLQNWCFYSMIT